MAADHQRAWADTTCTKCVCASPFRTQRRALLHSAQRGSKALCICLEDLELIVVVVRVVHCNQFRYEANLAKGNATVSGRDCGYNISYYDIG